MLKKLLVALFLLVVLIGVGGYFLSTNLDTIVKRAVETYGSAATLTPVTLDRVRLTLASGEAALEGLSVGSPKGYTGDKSFYLGRVAVKVDTKSIQGTGPVIIDSIVIESPQVLYEMEADGSNNLQTLAHNAQTYASSLTGGKKKQEPVATSTAAQDKPGRKFIIKDLVMRGGEVSILHPLLQGQPLTAVLPPLHLTDIGKNAGGASGGEVAQILISVVSSAATQVASQNLAGTLSKNLQKTGLGAADELTKKAGGALKGLLGQ